jgi:hypothetical protein
MTTARRGGRTLPEDTRHVPAEDASRRALLDHLGRLLAKEYLALMGANPDRHTGRAKKRKA